MEKGISIDKARSVWFLTAALVMVATFGVGATGWTKGITIITFVGLGSVLIGTMLARSILPWFVAHLFSFIIDLGWSFWVTSRLLPAHYTWLERWQNLATRLNTWYELARQGGTSYDNLMFIFQMGVIVWLMGYFTVWFIFRSAKVWPAIVPGGLVLLINLYYAPSDITFWFILYMLMSLLLVIRFNLFTQENKWRAEGVFFRPDISFDFLRDGFIFSAVIIAVAWFSPPIVDAKTIPFLDEFQGSWRDMQNEWNRMFADLNYRDRVSFDTFGSSLKLGGPRRLTDEPVMDVKVDGLGRYWRAVVYDYYSGDGWLTRDEDSASFGPDEYLSLPQFEAREPVTQTFTFFRDNATVLYAMANPVSLDRTAKATFTALTDQQIAQISYPSWPDTGEPWVEEITYLRSNATVDRGESYQVVSMASLASVSELETAGTDYPAWVLERYLQLPDSITERTRQLAREIAAPYDNSFAKAQALERYLRNNIKYNEGIATPPPGIDKVDYILFTAKEGYCDYYASAMIVMLRSLGIPARFAAGFARGVFDSDTDSFRVLSKDAHSWVEAYFPKYGWVEFEPTAAQPIIIRPTASGDGSLFSGGFDVDGPAPDQSQFADRPDGTFEDDAPFGTGALSFISLNIPLFGTFRISWSVVNSGVYTIGVVVVVLVIAGTVWWRNQSKINLSENIFTSYQRMLKFAGWMGLAMRPWQTPYEHAAVLQRNMPTYRREVQDITTEYVYQTFSSKNGATPNSAQIYYIAEAWSRLRPAMLKEAFKRRLPKWVRW
jgi:transglutaminase-like putative cysteine protease